MRTSDRAADELRPVEILTGVNQYAEGSCLIKVGLTEVLCTASVEDRVPPFLHNSGEGWVTAEYGMLPRATGRRNQRERAGGRPNGRTYEIQRLIGRALRAIVDRKVIGERTIWIDCDVLQADGGTRCAAITGGFVALGLAFDHLAGKRQLSGRPLIDFIGAISSGIVAGETLLDLDYAEDSSAEVDLNVVRTGGGQYVELQGTAEERPFSRDKMNELLDLADTGIETLRITQAEALEHCLSRVLR